MCLCYLFSAKTAWQLVNRKADIFYKTNGFESIHITNRIGSIRIANWNALMIGWRDVTESVVTIRSPCCGYSMAWCVELKGEDLWIYSHKIESVSLLKYLYDHWKKVKFSHTRYRALGPELIPVYRQSARRWREVNHAIDLAVVCHCFLPGLRFTFVAFTRWRYL